MYPFPGFSYYPNVAPRNITTSRKLYKRLYDVIFDIQKKRKKKTTRFSSRRRDATALSDCFLDLTADRRDDMNTHEYRNVINLCDKYTRLSTVPTCRVIITN